MTGECPSAAHGTNRDPYGCYERERAIEARVGRAVEAAVATPPARRLADRYLDEGSLVAQQFAGQDRLDPARPSLGILVAEALAAAEKRGEQSAVDGRDIALAALADLVSAVDAYRDEASHPALIRLWGEANRARRHLRPSEDGQ